MTPEDCQFLYQGEFAQSMQYDAWEFTRFVAGKHRVRPSRLTQYLASGLHLEMKLGRANIGLPSRYLPNNVEHNVWLAMSNRTTLISAAEKDLSGEKYNIFAQLRESPSIPQGYEAQDYDLNHLKLLIDLKKKGLAYFPNWASKPPWRPPELGTIGLCQRLANMFYEYEFCWDMTQRPAVVASPPPKEDLRNWLPFLHAPLHISFLGVLEKLPIGLWLIQKEYLRKEKLRDTLEDKFVTWWKMDSLRTYYGIQLLFRRIAMNTWLPEITDKDIEAVITKAKSAFEETFSETRNKKHDWLDLAADFQNEELQLIISRTLKTISDQEPCILDHPNIGRKVLVLSEYDVDGRQFENALRINSEENHTHCLGAVCYRHAELDLKLPQDCGYLIEDISNAGGNFTGHPEYIKSEDFSSHCWGGTHFEGGIMFNSVDNAIAYLKQYFHIQAAEENEFYTQEWVDWV